MSRERLLLDTVFIEALLNARDQHHSRAMMFLSRMRDAAEVWVTEAVLLEVGNALSVLNREAAVGFIRQCYETENIQVVPMSTELLRCGLDMYESGSDKTWSLTDCISFVVMKDQRLTGAATMDHHFVQAGYRALMREI